MKIKIFCAVLLLIPAVTMADVFTKYGNFATAFDDLQVEIMWGGEYTVFSRTYYSNATRDGWFGPGWDSPYETKELVLSGAHPDKIETSDGDKIYLKWTNDGHIAEARTEDNMKMLYTYDKSGNLVLANKVGGNYYRYEYDGNHKMTRIGYIDNTHKDIQYNKDGFVSSVTEPDGAKATYSYRSDPKKPAEHYWTTTTSTSVSGQKTSLEEEFYVTTTANGAKIIETAAEKQLRQERDEEYKAAQRLESSRVRGILRACKTEKFDIAEIDHELDSDIKQFRLLDKELEERDGWLEGIRYTIYNNESKQNYNQMVQEQNQRIDERNKKNDRIADKTNQRNQMLEHFNANCKNIAMYPTAEDVQDVCGSSNDDYCMWLKKN